MKRILTIAILFLTFMALPVFSSGRRDTGAPFDDCCIEEVYQIHLREVVRIGVITDNAPFSYQDAGNVWQGSDIVFARGLAAELLGRDERFLRLVPVTHENWIGLLNSNQLDFVLGFSLGGEWDGQAGFSIPFRRAEGRAAAAAVKKENDGLIMWLNDVISRRMGINLLEE